jgi:hypothetical protein
MARLIISEEQLRKIIRKNISEQEVQQTQDEPQQERCLTNNTIPLEHIVGLNDNFQNYTSKLYKRSGGIRGMVDALDILRTIRLHDEINDNGENLAYDLMNHLITFQGKNYFDDTTSKCHKAIDKVVELYKENEHGEELVKDIEKVLGHSDPSQKAKEYLKACLEIVKGK